MRNGLLLTRFIWIALVASAFLLLDSSSTRAAAPAATFTISGTVRTHDGTPVQGAFVGTALLDPEIAFAFTDAQGKYTLSLTTPGAYHISVSYYYNQLDPPAQTVTVPPSKSDLNFTFAESYTIRGVVTGPDGQPAPGATVATNDLTDPLGASTTADANGAYTLTLGPGIYHVSAGLTGLISPPAQRIIVPPSRTGIDFALLTAYTIQGTVRTFDGQPASSFNIATSEDDPMLAFATTGTDGAYTLFVAAGTYHLTASFLGFGTPPAKTVTVPPSRTGVDFTMLEPALVRGTVRDDTGQPVSGAFVNEGSISSATTAADGTYTLELSPGEHLINVYSDAGGYNVYDRGHDLAFLSVPPAITDLDFVLRRRNRTITGRVVDHEGQPVALADVFATNPLDGTGQVRSSDANGFYTLTVPSGVFWVYVVKRFSVFDHNPNRLTPFYPSFSQQVDVSLAPAQAINFALQPVTGLITVHGRVKDHLGGPVSAVVSATPTDPLSCDLPERVVTDETGVYTMTIRPGEYSMSVFHENTPGLPNQIISVPPAATVDFTYPPLHVISGRVTKPSGKPLQYALMQATTAGVEGVYNSVITGSDGYYYLYVAAGDYTVTAYLTRYSSSPGQAVSVPPGPTNVDFTLTPIPPPDLLIRGKVVDEEGKPAPTAVVVLAEVALSNKSVYYDGNYAMSVYPGAYTVYAGGKDFISSPTKQATVPPSKTGLDLTVRRADHYLFGQVKDIDGNVLCNATVTVTGTGVSTSVMTNSSGRFALRLPQGVYSLSATRTGYPTPPAQTVTVPPTATQIEFVMQAGQTGESVYLPAILGGP